jgi:hypothetical protein
MKQTVTLIIALCIATALSPSEVSAATDRFRAIIQDDPATTISIGWNQVSGDRAVVHYGEKDHGQSHDQYKLKTEVTRHAEHRGMRNCFAHLTGLKPNTRYYFVIADADGPSKRMFFKTLPADDSQRISFIVGGDSRSFREPRRLGNLIVAKMRPHAVIFAGDMINHSTDLEWAEWLDDWQSTIALDGRLTPIVAARGNHEKKNADIHKIFDVPHKRIYYGLRFGGNLMHLYTLNTEVPKGGRQAAWLKRELKANQDATWHVAQYHRPVRPHIARKPEGKGQYRYWVPKFEKYNVKLGIECDSHTHKITWPLKSSDAEGNDEGFVRDDAEGIVYVGEGCWGAPLQVNDDDKSWTRDSGRVNQVKWLIVDKDKMEVRTIEFDNAEDVSSVDDSDIYKYPSALKVRLMKGGDVVTISK